MSGVAVGGVSGKVWRVPGAPTRPARDILAIAAEAEALNLQQVR
jgi:hypothetical protein